MTDVRHAPTALCTVIREGRDDLATVYSVGRAPGHVAPSPTAPIDLRLYLDATDLERHTTVRLSTDAARALRDRLDAALGEQRATIPAGFSGSTR